MPQQPCATWVAADDASLYDCGTCFDGRSDYLIADALADASFLLWSWTGYRWSGLCDYTVWPQVQWGTTTNLPRWTWRGTPGLQDWWYGGWNNSGGLWGEAWCGCNRVGSPLVRRGTQCGCEGVSQIRLGVGTIDSITEVLIDGDVIDAGPGFGYEVRNGSWLVRLPDEGSTDRNYWPSRNRLDLTEDDDHTFVVSFVGGAEPPDMGKRAAIALACELVTARCSPGDCNLPANVSSFTREGIDVQVIAPQVTESIQKSLPLEVQLFLDSVNPHGVRMAPRIFSADLVEQYSQVTWSAP